VTYSALRRLFVLLIVLAACGGPLQPAPTKVYRIAWLSASTQANTATYIDAFRSAVRDRAYVEGKNMSVDARYADGYSDRLPALAAELVALKPDILVAQIVGEAQALKQATTAIPIVLSGVPDPVGNGLVANLSVPGGNITGAARASSGSQNPRRLQLLKEAVPGSSRFAYLYEPTSQQASILQELRAVAPALGGELLAFQVRSPDELESTFAAVTLSHPDAIYVNGGPLSRSQQARILDFATANRLPTIGSGNRDFADPVG
jgi:putative ABC transport system substrate-binding protein